MIYKRYFFAWFGMVVIAIANGTLRQIGYAPVVGDLAGHQISSVTLIVFFFLYLTILNRRWKIKSAKEAWLIGLMWLGFTVAFEFGVGHYAYGLPWNKLLHDYNIFEGRVWSFVLIAILVGPSIVYRRSETPDVTFLI